MMRRGDLRQCPAEPRSVAYATGRRVLGSVATDGPAAVFAQVMGLVAFTLAFTALGSYIGRDLGRGAAIGCLIGGCAGILISEPAARHSDRLAIAALFSAGLLLGLGLAPGLHYYTQAEPQAVWQTAAATALFTAALGTAGYLIRRDLSIGYRALFVLLVGVLAVGLVVLCLSIPNGNLVYAGLGAGVFGGYTVADFHRLRNTGIQQSAPLAAGIFVDVVNVFLCLLDISGGD